MKHTCQTKCCEFEDGLQPDICPICLEPVNVEIADPVPEPEVLDLSAMWEIVKNINARVAALENPEPIDTEDVAPIE